jgi:Pro-kumamolisin, activation domain/Abnormal spindle-like microcephaly-assoc'd, ASPM-SPD-2-Hydin
MKFQKRNRSSVRLLISPACIAVMLLMFARLTAWSQQPDVSTTQPPTRAFNTPKQVFSGAVKPIQAYDPSSKLRLAISIKAPKMAEEEEFLKQLQDKTSPNYHKYLTPAQWNARFAPSAEDEQAVVDWATHQGLTITARYPNRLMVNVEGTVDTIQKAFNIKINRYPVNGQTEFSNDRDPEIPANLQGIVQFVDGLNSIMRMRPANSQMKGVRGPDYAPGPMHQVGEIVHRDADSAAAQVVNTPGAQIGSQITGGFYDPTDFWSQQGYDYNALQAQGHCCNPLHNANQTPPETTIGLATDGDFANSDMVGFQAQYPYLAYHFGRVFVNGTPGGGDDETTLDLEWTTATSNSRGSYIDTSLIWVYEAAQGFGDFGTLFQQMLNDNRVRVVNISYGLSEQVFLDDAPSLLTAWHAIFNQMSGQGWTIMAASGDGGSDAGCTGSLAVLYPESDPDVTSVGGTELFLNLDGSFNTEVAWTGGTSPGSCSHNNGGGGGGCSVVWSAPSYQVNPYCGSSSRSVPDVSLNAGVGTNFFFNGSLSGVGGTSLASPLMSGFIAQENAYSLSMGNACDGTHNCAPIGLVNKDIYAEGGYNMSAPHYPFYDITSGCTTNDTISSFWCAASGYDLATGWGSFNALQMAWAINWEDNLAYSAPSVVYSGPATNTWYNTNQTVSWSINANSNPTGIAGFTQGWDSIPSDPHGDTNRNDSNSFFSGPQFPNATTGCVDFTGAAGCAGGVSQGCHTAHVRAWSNQGSTSGDTTYGPICYDTVAPTVTASDSPAPNSSGYNNTSVKITLTATDATSGIKHTYYAVDTTACTSSTLGSCAVYSGPITISATGTHYVEYLTQDNAGNFSGEGIDYVYIDEVAPVTTSSLSGVLKGSAFTTPVKVTLSASDNYSGVASTIYSVDGGAGIPYSAPFTVTGVGSHYIHYRSTDHAGNTEVTEIKTFSISALPALTLSATSVAFGNQAVGTSSALQTVTITNSGTGELTFTGIVLGGTNANQFSTSNNCGNLAGGASCTIRLRFNPTLKQSDTASITITDDASGSPHKVSITGTGVAPVVSLSATSVAFGNQAAGTSSGLQTVTVTNSGNSTLSFTSIVLGGTNANQFSTSNNCGNLAGGTACTIRLRFNPTVKQSDTATLTITDNASGSPQTVSITGTGD